MILNKNVARAGGQRSSCDESYVTPGVPCSWIRPPSLRLLRTVHFAEHLIRA